MNSIFGLILYHRTRHGGTVAASAASVLLDHFAGPSAAALCFHYACRLLTWQGASVEKSFRFGDVQSTFGTFAFGQLDVVESAGDAPFRIGGPTPGGRIGLLQLDSAMLCCVDNEALETAFNALLDTLRPLLGSAAQPHCMQGKATFADIPDQFRP